jgi:hypothetical protein
MIKRKFFEEKIVETLHATSFFSSSAMNNKERRNMLRLYKNKKKAKNREIS